MACPICKNTVEINKNHGTRDARVIKCVQCGFYTISRTANTILENNQSFQDDGFKISAWINEFKPEIITSAVLETARASTPPSLHHRAERMLRWIANRFPPGTEFSIKDLGHLSIYKPTPGIIDLGLGDLVSSPLIPIGWNKSIAEMEFMVTEVLSNELELLASQNNHDYRVSPKGLLYLEGRRESISSTGFCAMWFNDEVLPLWINVIEPAIRLAGYEPIKIDLEPHNGKIDDAIIANIRACKFVVADITGNRGGVYYEAGFAHGLGKDVIFMCRRGDSLHFDIQQYNCIFWTPEKLEEAQSQLKNRILATLGQGPKLVQ